MGCKLTVSVHPSKSPLHKSFKKSTTLDSPAVATGFTEDAPDKEDGVPSVVHEPTATSPDQVKCKDLRANFMSTRYIPPPPKKKRWTPP